jgi:hypothetical protein
MPKSALPRYCAYAAQEGRAHGHVVEAAGFADAAMQFVDVWHPQPDDGDEVRVIVRDQASGEEQCFRIDLSLGETEPCEQQDDRMAS